MLESGTIVLGTIISTALYAALIKYFFKASLPPMHVAAFAAVMFATQVAIYQILV